MAIEDVTEQTARQKLGEIECLLHGLDAVVAEIQGYVDGTNGFSPCQPAHGLQSAALVLIDRGLQLTGAR